MASQYEKPVKPVLIQWNIREKPFGKVVEGQSVDNESVFEAQVKSTAFVRELLKFVTPSEIAWYLSDTNQGMQMDWSEGKTAGVAQNNYAWWADQYFVPFQMPDEATISLDQFLHKNELPSAMSGLLPDPEEYNYHGAHGDDKGFINTKHFGITHRADNQFEGAYIQGSNTGRVNNLQMFGGLASGYTDERYQPTEKWDPTWSPFEAWESNKEDWDFGLSEGFNSAFSIGEFKDEWSSVQNSLKEISAEAIRAKYETVSGYDTHGFHNVKNNELLKYDELINPFTASWGSTSGHSLNVNSEIGPVMAHPYRDKKTWNHWKPQDVELTTIQPPNYYEIIQSGLWSQWLNDNEKFYHFLVAMTESKRRGMEAARAFLGYAKDLPVGDFTDSKGNGAATDIEVLQKSRKQCEKIRYWYDEVMNENMPFTNNWQTFLFFRITHPLFNQINMLGFDAGLRPKNADGTDLVKLDRNGFINEKYRESDNSALFRYSTLYNNKLWSQFTYTDTHEVNMFRWAAIKAAQRYLVENKGLAEKIDSRTVELRDQNEIFEQKLKEIVQLFRDAGINEIEYDGNKTWTDQLADIKKLMKQDVYEQLVIRNEYATEYNKQQTAYNEQYGVYEGLMEELEANIQTWKKLEQEYNAGRDELVEATKYKPDYELMSSLVTQMNDLNGEIREQMKVVQLLKAQSEAAYEINQNSYIQMQSQLDSLVWDWNELNNAYQHELYVKSVWPPYEINSAYMNNLVSQMNELNAQIRELHGQLDELQQTLNELGGVEGSFGDYQTEKAKLDQMVTDWNTLNTQYLGEVAKKETYDTYLPHIQRMQQLVQQLDQQNLEIQQQQDDVNEQVEVVNAQGEITAQACAQFTDQDTYYQQIKTKVDELEQLAEKIDVFDKETDMERVLKHARWALGRENNDSPTNTSSTEDWLKVKHGFEELYVDISRKFEKGKQQEDLDLLNLMAPIAELFRSSHADDFARYGHDRYGNALDNTEPDRYVMRVPVVNFIYGGLDKFDQEQTATDALGNPVTVTTGANTWNPDSIIYEEGRTLEDVQTDVLSTSIWCSLPDSPAYDGYPQIGQMGISWAGSGNRRDGVTSVTDAYPVAGKEYLTHTVEVGGSAAPFDGDEYGINGNKFTPTLWYQHLYRTQRDDLKFTGSNPILSPRGDNVDYNSAGPRGTLNEVDENPAYAAGSLAFDVWIRRFEDVTLTHSANSVNLASYRREAEQYDDQMKEYKETLEQEAKRRAEHEARAQAQKKAEEKKAEEESMRRAMEQRRKEEEKARMRRMAERQN